MAKCRERISDRTPHKIETCPESGQAQVVRFQRNSPLARRFRDAGALCVVGLSISAAIGFLQDPTPFGDDAIYYIGTVKALTSNFPFLAWDPHVFAGYMPAIGLSWLTFLAPFVLARIGLDAISSFHLSFVAVFLLFGLAVYYSARSVGSGRLVSFSMSILAWSTNAYWNNTIWGGAYNRAFTIPFLFLAMGATYRYAGCMNAAKAQGSNYWLGVAAWTLAYVGDIFVAIAGAALGLAFLLLSAGRRSIVTVLKPVHWSKRLDLTVLSWFDLGVDTKLCVRSLGPLVGRCVCSNKSSSIVDSECPLGFALCNGSLLVRNGLASVTMAVSS